MLHNGMIIIGKIENERTGERDKGVVITDPRAIMLGQQSTQGVSINIQNFPFMFSKKTYLHPGIIMAETADGYIDVNIKKAYIESVTSIKIPTIGDTRHNGGRCIT